MSFKKDITQVRSFESGKIKETGWYAFTILKAYDRDSQSSLSKAIHFDVVTDSGQSSAFDLWYQGKDGTGLDKNGKSLSALSTINDLIVICEIDNLTPKPAMVDIYDFDLRADVKQKKMSYHDLVGRHVGGVFQMVSEGKRSQLDGVWKTSSSEFVQKPEFKCFTDDEGRSSKEFLDCVEPKSIEKYVSGLDQVRGIAPGDDHIIKQASNQPNAPVGDAPGFIKKNDYDDSIPF